MRFNAPCFTLLIMCVCTVFLTQSTLAANTATTTITGKVYAACTVSMPGTLQMPEIPFSAFDGITPGTLLEQYKVDLLITGNCSGGAKYSYTLTPNDWTYTGGCIDPASPAKNMIYLCVKYNGTQLDFVGSKNPKIDNLNNGDTTLSIIPSVGSRPKAGSYTATLSVKIEPM